MDIRSLYELRPSVRSAEATSLAWATHFNHANVDRFFNSLGQVIERYYFDGSDIWNEEERFIRSPLTWLLESCTWVQ